MSRLQLALNVTDIDQAVEGVYWAASRVAA